MSNEDIFIQDNERAYSEESTRTGSPPRAGCLIFAALGAFFIGIVIFVIVNAASYHKSLTPYVSEQAIELPVDRGSVAELDAIRAEVATFREAIFVTSDDAVELALSPRELNILIENDPYLLDVKRQYYLKSLSAAKVFTALCSRMMPKIIPWKPRRYLNGEMDLELEAENGRVFLRIVSVRVDGEEMPAEMISAWKTRDQLELYKNDDRFAEVLEEVNSARVENGSLILSTAPPPAENIPAERTPASGTPE